MLKHFCYLFSYGIIIYIYKLIWSFVVKNNENGKIKKVKYDSKIKADYAEKFLVGERKFKKKKAQYTSPETLEKSRKKKGKKRKIKKVEKLNAIQTGSQEKKNIVLIAKREKSDMPLSPIKKLKNILSYGIVCILAVILGFFAGNMYVEANFSNTYDYDEIAFRYTASEIENFKKTYTNVATTNALYAFIIAEEKLKTLDYVCETPENSSYTAPDIAPTQTIYSYRKKSGQYYEYITASDGIMAVAEKVITNDGGQNYDIWSSNKISNNRPIFGETANVNMTQEEAKTEYGTDMTNPVPYVVSDRTIHASYGANPALTGFGKLNDDGNYEFTLKLNTEESVMNYVKQIKHMSGLKNYPVFFDITINFVLDSEFRFVSMHTVEHYKVSYFGVPAKCSAELVNVFTYL